MRRAIGSLSSPSSQQSSYIPMRIITWNIWFHSYQYQFRIKRLIDMVVAYEPDIICFQEILPAFQLMIISHPTIMEGYQISPITTESYYTLSIVKSYLKPSFIRIPFPTEMGRDLLISVLEYQPDTHIAIGNVHLESLDNHMIREKQLQICHNELSRYTHSVLVGDFNFCSERNYVIKSGEPLENDSLAEFLPNYVDVWPALHPQQTDAGNPLSTPPRSNPSTLGFTFNSDINKMINKHEVMRYDRILTKLGGESKATHIELIGVEPIDSEGKIWPSDHFGLLCELSLRTKDSKPMKVHSPEASPPLKSSAITPDDLRNHKLNANPEGTVVTSRDGSRCLEYIDKATGEISRKKLDGKNASHCQLCGESLGFTLEGSEKMCESCTRMLERKDLLSDPQYLPYSEIEEKVQRVISRALNLSPPVRLLAIDFDATLCQIHTYGRWDGTAEALAGHIRPVFRCILETALQYPDLRIAIVTFSGQSRLIKNVLILLVGKERAARIYVRGADRRWDVPANCVSMDGKQPHIASVLQDMYFDRGEEVLPNQVILIDDDERNIEFAKVFGHRTVVFPRLPLHGIHMKSLVQACGVTIHKRIQLRYGTILCISQGSVVDFDGHDFGAIVNAANSGGLGGGGVDGAISTAGGDKLFAARKSLPIVAGTRCDRIPVGACRVVGPNKFGKLKVPYVIHSVGPNYTALEGQNRHENIEESLRHGDELLRSAYISSMEAAAEKNIELLGFSLLSAGIFRGRQSLEKVLRIAVEAVSSHVYSGLREVHLVSFNHEELTTLLRICEFNPPPEHLLGTADGVGVRTFLDSFENAVEN